MSLSSVTPTASPAAPTGVDAIATESSASPHASGFELLLAAHSDPNNGHSTCDVSERDAGDHPANTSEADTPCVSDPPADSVPTTKPDRAADAEGLAAQLATQAVPPAPAPPEPVTPPAGDPLDSAAVLEAAAAAASPVEPDPSEVAAPPAADDSASTSMPVLDVAPSTLDPDLTALLVATASNDAAVPSIASVPIPSFLDAPNAPAPHNSEKHDPTPTTLPPTSLPGPVPNNPAPPDRARTAPTDTGSVGYAPASGPASATPAAVNAEAAAATAATAAPAPAEQLVSILTPLRATPNGSYTLRLELKPAELGRVEIRVEMRDGVLHASIHADHESSAQLVRASLNELRDQLAAEGVRTGTLTVSDGAHGSSGRDGHARQAGGDPSKRGASTEPGNADEPSRPTPGEVPPTLDSDTTSLLDVRV